MNPLVTFDNWDRAYYVHLFTESKSGEEQNKLIKETIEQYTEILRNKGLRELQAITSFLIELRDDHKGREESSEKELRLLYPKVAGLRKMVRDGENLGPKLIARKKKLEDSIGSQLKRRDLSQIQRGEIEFRIRFLDLIFRRYCLHGGYFTVKPDEYFDELASAHEASMWRSEVIRDRLYEALTKKEGFFSNESVPSGPWFWTGTAEQLSYLIWMLKGNKLILPSHYWVKATSLFLNEDGSPYDPDSLRTRTGSLDFSGGHACSTRAGDIDEIILGLLAPEPGDNDDRTNE